MPRHPSLPINQSNIGIKVVNIQLWLMFKWMEMFGHRQFPFTRASLRKRKHSQKGVTSSKWDGRHLFTAVTALSTLKTWLLVWQSDLNSWNNQNKFHHRSVCLTCRLLNNRKMRTTVSHHSSIVYVRLIFYVAIFWWMVKTLGKTITTKIDSARTNSELNLAKEKNHKWNTVSKVKIMKGEWHADWDGMKNELLRFLHNAFCDVLAFSSLRHSLHAIKQKPKYKKETW